MNQWKCALLERPTYYGLQRLRREILNGATVRDGVSVAIHAAAYLHRQPGGPELLRGFYEVLKTVAPSEREELFASDPSQSPPAPVAAVAPPVGEAQPERVVLQAGR